jgi:hypothetical protein
MFVQGGNSAAAFTMGQSQNLLVQKRRTPTVVLTTAGSGGFSSGPNIQALTPRSIGFNATFTASTGAYLFVDYTADAEL